VSSQNDDTGSITVVNDYRWIGDPRLGAVSVYVDGRQAGVAPLRGRLDLDVPSGRHQVRVRHRWYLSPRVIVEVRPGAVSVVRADKPDGSVGRAMLRLALHPLTAWSLVVDHTGMPVPASVAFTATDERRSKLLRVYGFVMLGVFLLIALLARFA